MRYVLVFVLLATVMMAFIFADHFPGFLSHYPRLQEANWTVRDWLGMDSPRSSPLSEQNLKETERMLGKQVPTKHEINGQDLQDYHE